ncbi:WecB/TagA/CpsF family glycosyltransferase [uncultured Desulfosarcina sp.]|uniref:WecB/TagA/CpsF family glycosyltransferase n=1 Tax=uncultured Desulfosarcina sp. TaxID=218289 RepID=UPI0029C6261F|nr:WecB/TagA/CpsF family glycosyltransferase [uncultured Desulfosarcina sp.]
MSKELISNAVFGMKQNNISKHETVKFIDVPFTCLPTTAILANMEKSILNQEAGNYVSITNTESVYHALKIPAHMSYIQNANFSCCDGVGLVFAAKLLGLEIPRLHGPDLMLKCCEFGISRKWSHFFYGGKPGVPERLVSKFSDRYAGMIAAGTYSPPFRELTHQEEKKIIDMINQSNPDILWVGLGLLKQERWIARHRTRLNAKWMIGVGAAFDFHAGTIKRAPKVYRDLGLEWLYRVVFEPRMIRRNIYSALIFPQVIKAALNRTG